MLAVPIAPRLPRFFVLAGLLLLSLAALGTWATPPAHARATVVSTIPNVKSYPAFGDVDTVRNRVYFTSLGGDDGLGSGPDYLTVIDGNTDKVIAEVRVADHPSGVDVDETTGQIYVSNTSGNPISLIPPSTVAGGGGNIMRIDPNTFQILETIQVPAPPGARLPITKTITPITGKPSQNGWPGDLRFDPSTKLLWVGNSGDLAAGKDADCCFVPGVVSVWDTVNHKWLKGGVDGIPAGISPIEPAINFKTKRLYIGSIHTNSVTVIDITTQKVIKTIEISAEPYGVDVDEANNRVYVGHIDSRGSTSPSVGCPTCPDGVRAFKAVVDVIDGKTDTVWDTFYAGSFTRNVKVDPNTSRAYVANLNTHSLTIVQGRRVVGQLQTGFGPRGLAINPVTHKIYVGNTAQSTGVVDLPDGVPDSITVIHDIPGIRLAVSPGKAKAKKRTCFTFRARNSYSTRVLSGASISFAGSNRKTNKSGRAEFCERPSSAGKLSARATKKDFETGKTSVRVGR